MYEQACDQSLSNAKQLLGGRNIIQSGTGFVSDTVRPVLLLHVPTNPASLSHQPTSRKCERAKSIQIRNFCFLKIKGTFTCNMDICPWALLSNTINFKLALSLSLSHTQHITGILAMHTSNKESNMNVKKGKCSSSSIQLYTCFLFLSKKMAWGWAELRECLYIGVRTRT